MENAHLKSLFDLRNLLAEMGFERTIEEIVASEAKLLMRLQKRDWEPPLSLGEYLREVIGNQQFEDWVDSL